MTTQNPKFPTSELSFRKMEVIKRDGRREKVSFDKVTRRIEALCWGLDRSYIDPIGIAQETIKGIQDGITTVALDYLSADICATRISDHPDFNQLAARICISNLHKSVDRDIQKVAHKLYHHNDNHGQHNPLITQELYELIEKHHERIQQEIDYDRDYLVDFFGMKTLERSYLKRIKTRNQSQIDNQRSLKKIRALKRQGALSKELKHEEQLLEAELKVVNERGIIVECPQDMWMRVALGIHGEDLERAFETYHLMSRRKFTHATPTLFNAGCYNGQLSSCFLLAMEDSINGIFKAIADCARISKLAGGIGIHLSSVRASGSRIRTTNGNSSGLIPWCRLLCETARSVNQGGKRKGSIAVYLEPWHADIFEFVELRKNTGDELMRARDLFLALWVCDLFMKRVEEDGVWSLMCPDECPGLTDSYGAKFEELYEGYEAEGRYRRQVRARDLWFHILEAQIETGMPYMAYKDNANERSNQKNLGVIKSSNLCCEIFEYSSTAEYATCNLASISLPSFLQLDEAGEVKYDEHGEPMYDYEELAKVSGVVTRNLDRVIDINHYPVPETEVSNMKHRPIGIGVQGLADLFCQLKLPFDSEEARVINRKVHETIYYGALKMSCELAKEKGAYSSFEGSPFSEGKLQYHLWGLDESDLLMKWDWTSLVNEIKTHGTRNSLLTALMPTASTSQILGNNECIEPFTTNLYTRSTLAGEYTIINRYLVLDLVKRGLWNPHVRDELKFFNGSIQMIEGIPDEVKALYRTSFELPQKSLIQLAIDRGPFIDQSQSLNLFIGEPDFARLTSSHFFGWENGLKTGLYYLRSRPSANAIMFGLDPDTIERIRKKYGLDGYTELSDDEETVSELDTDSITGIEELRAVPTPPKEKTKAEKIAEMLSRFNQTSREDTYEPCEMCSG